jgi:hypothetical protein
MRKALWKILPIVIGVTFGLFLANPPQLFRAWGWPGWLIIPGCFLSLIFILMPGYLFTKMIFKDVTLIPVERDLRRKDIRDLAEQFWKFGFRPAGAALSEPSPPGQIIGFVREDIAVYGAIIRAEAGFGRTTFGFFSVLGEWPLGLTTFREKGAAVSPRAPGNFCQIFPRLDMPELLLKHIQGLEFLHSNGIITRTLTGDKFAEDQLLGAQKQREYLRKDWFRNVAKFVWRLGSRINPYSNPIEKQQEPINYIRQVAKVPAATPQSQARQNLIIQLGQLLAIPADLPHSGYGIASFAISLSCVLVVFLAIVFAGIIGVVKGGATDQSSSLTAVFGLMILFCGLGYIIGLALGITGMMDKRRKKIFSVLGIVINILGLSLLAGLIILGSMLGHH